MKSLKEPNSLYPFKGEFSMAKRVVDILMDQKIELVITVGCASEWFARRAKQVIAIGAKDRQRLKSFTNVIQFDRTKNLIRDLLPALNQRVLAYIGLEASAEEIQALEGSTVVLVEKPSEGTPVVLVEKPFQARDYWQLIQTEFPSYISRFNWQELLLPGSTPIPGVDQTCSPEQFRLIYNGLRILKEVTVDSVDVAEQGNGDQAKVLFALAPLFEVRVGIFDLNPNGTRAYHIGLVNNNDPPVLLAACCEKLWHCLPLRELREGLPKFEKSLRPWPLPNLIKPRERLIQCHLSGGLGNQLFQMATSFHYAKEQNARVVFSQELYGYRPDNWAVHFGLPCEAFQPAKFYQEPTFAYKPLPAFFDRITLTGYWQSDSYFDHEILPVLEPFMEKAKQLFTKYPADSRALHVRRGDYTHCPVVHPCAPLEYYREVLALTKGPLLIFSDDLEWCKEQFPNCEYVTIGDPLMELLVMSQCQTIIAANSTFSWWAGYLSKPGTKVSLPKVWFGPEGPQDWSNIYYRKLHLTQELQHGYLYQQVDPSCEFKIYQGHDRIALLNQAKNDRFAVIAKPEFQWANDKLFKLAIKRIVQRYSGLGVCGLVPNGVCKPRDELVSLALDCDLSTAFVVSCYEVEKLIANPDRRSGLITAQILS